jgi:phospholipid/cholesterol/gamma-HCH transport system permease protein
MFFKKIKFIISNHCINYINAIGIYVNNIIFRLGHFTLFVLHCIVTFIKKPLHRKQLIEQMYLVGIQSFGIIFLTGCFAGLALTIQSYNGFSRVHAEQFTGLVVVLALTRELAPILTAIITSAKSGSAMAAEIGTMKITEQIDALKTLLIDPFSFLIVPRILATTIMLPFMTLFAMLFGILASYFLSVYVFNINEIAYVSIIQEHVLITDITGGLIKAVVFGFLISWVGTYMGYETEEGARGVGKATTKAVVVGSILILIVNYMLTSFLINTGIS